MERYDYNAKLKEDVKNYIEDINLLDYADKDDAYNQLYEMMWCEDRITGNASGSYFCNAWRAEECLAHNWDLLKDALNEFGYTDTNIIEKGAEWCDVTIRCYLLSPILQEVLDEIWTDEDDEDDEEL